MPTSTDYASFMVRLWCESDLERGAAPAGWQGEVQHIQTGRRRAFSSLDELLGLLRQATEEADAPGRTANQ